MSGALGGAATGAVGGSAFGPVGTVAGAAIGAIGSIIGGSMTNAANSRAAQAQIFAQEAMQQNAQAFNSEQSWLAYLRSNEQMKNAQAFDQQSQQISQNFGDYERQQIQDWESSMSNTAYQRSVADMKAAGLNPILGVASGGASTPGVGMPSAGTPTSPMGSAPAASSPMGSASKADVVNVMGGAVNTALRAMDTINGLRATDAQVQQTQAATDKIRADTDLTRAQLPGAAAASSAQAATASQLAGLSVSEVEQRIDNLRRSGANIDANTAAAFAQRLQSLASAGYSGAQTALANFRLDYQRQTGSDIGYNPAIGTVHGIATGVENAGSAFKSGLDDLFSKIGNAVSSAFAPVFNSARQGTRPGSAAPGLPSAPADSPYAVTQ